MAYPSQVMLMVVVIVAAGSPEGLRYVGAADGPAGLRYVGAADGPEGLRYAGAAGSPEGLLYVHATRHDARGGQDVPPIRSFLQINDDFCTGGQPRPEHFAELKAKGVKSVLNLRTPGEHRAAEEQAEVERLEMRYFNIPVVYSAPTDAQVDEFLKITDDPANRPMFIHCTAAIRVGAFWAIRRVMRDGMTLEKALEEARKVGLLNAPHLDDLVHGYTSRHGK